MSALKDGGPAFPAGVVRKTRPAHDPGADFHVTSVEEPMQPGMTLRDYFAAKALPAVISAYSQANGPCIGMDHILRNTPIIAFRLADAMLEAREVQP